MGITVQVQSSDYLTFPTAPTLAVFDAVTEVVWCMPHIGL
jgi:hypothetical protein